MQHILLVEDSEQCQKIVTRTLNHCQIQCVSTVDDALTALRNSVIDLILLDINLPKRNGYELLSELQSETTAAQIPVICLTGKTEVTDKVTAFSLGADDYLVKPFDPIELRARVDGRLSRIRRTQAIQQLIIVGGLEIDRQRHRVTLKEAEKTKKLDLTQTEFKLLCCLAERPEQVFTRDQLLVAAWGEDADVLDRAVDVHLCALRKKLGARGHFIQSVQGVGYRFCMDSVSEIRSEQKTVKRKAA